MLYLLALFYLNKKQYVKTTSICLEELNIFIRNNTYSYQNVNMLSKLFDELFLETLHKKNNFNFKVKLFYIIIMFLT